VQVPLYDRPDQGPVVRQNVRGLQPRQDVFL
jgi:hypothetical protein